MVQEILKAVFGIWFAYMLFKGLRFLFPSIFAFEKSDIKFIFYALWFFVACSLFFPSNYLYSLRPTWLNDWLVVVAYIVGQMGLVIVMNRIFKDSLQEDQQGKRS